jgi:hydrogenase expression/formation protein HypD
MRYIDEFRDKKLIGKLAYKIKAIAPRWDINLMEVCGTHTQTFRRFGLHKLLPASLRLIAGPGCPVCVCDQNYIDKAIAFAKNKDTIILSFGDMLRVPGSVSSLEKARAEGADVRILYSAWDSLKIAKTNPHKKVIFLAVGFETTAPTLALTLKAAKKEKIKNLFFFSGLKLIPAAMQALLKDKNLNLDGFLCPGHVSTIIGSQSYAFIPQRYKIGCCIAGFEPLDILEGIYLLIQQIVRHKLQVINQYTRVVTQKGNLKAQKITFEVFKISDATWRGLGKISKSGLKIKDKYARFDAEKIFSIKQDNACLPDRQEITRQRVARCRCGDILKGLVSPLDCPLFSRVCSPDNPVGPCMVSSEGACNAYYKYK